MNIENAILKKAIENQIYYSKVKNILNEKCFESFANSQIYKIIKDFYNNYNSSPTLSDIALKCREIPNSEVRTQIASSLNEIKNSETLNTDSLIDETLKFVKDSYFMRAMMAGAEFIDKKDEKAKVLAKELIEQGLKVSLDVDLGLDFNNIDERIDYYQNPKKGIKYTRFNELNLRLDEGYLPGTLNVFMAPAGIGKSLMMSTSITDFIRQGKNCLLISMEMESKQFVKRIDADLLDIDINSLKSVSPDFIKSQFEKAGNLGKFYTKTYPAGEFSANTLDSLLDMYLENGIDFDLIFLDYIGIMKSDRVSPNVGLYSYAKSITEEVRAVAIKRNKIIISANQLNRSSTNNLQADNSAISDSFGIIATVDFCCFILQTENLKADGKLLFKVTKNRYNGRTDTWEQIVDYPHMRIIDTTINKIENPADMLVLDNKANSLISELKLPKNPNVSNVSYKSENTNPNNFWNFNDY